MSTTKTFWSLTVAGIIWLLLTVFIALRFNSELPDSVFHWVLLVVLGPPFYLFGKALFGRLRLKERREGLVPKKFSPSRIVAALALLVPFVGLSWWLSWLLTKG